MDEQKIDRRAHWAQLAITGVILATGWCVRLEFTVSSLQKSMEEQKKSRDSEMAQLWNRFGSDHDMLTRLDQKVKDNELSTLRK